MKKIALVLTNLLVATSAIASDGFYVELSAGSAKSNIESDYSLTSTFTYFGDTETETETGTEKSPETSDTSFGGRFGYQFNDYIAVDIGHHQYGGDDSSYVDSGDDISEKIESSSISAGVKGIIPVSDDFSLFARVGIAKWDVEATVTDSEFPDEVFAIKEDDNDIYYGIGAEYSFSETISLGVEYSVLDMEWEVFESGEQNGENFSYSYTGHLKNTLSIENISLLLKISF